MSNIEKVKAEIERLKKILEESTYYLDNSQQALGYSFALDDFKEFIDSLPEEKSSEDFPTSDEEVAKFLATHPKVEVPEKYKTPNWLFDKQPSEDLEEAAEEYADKHGFRVPYDGSNNYYDDVDVKASKEGFLAGAEWQKDQMTKDAVEGEIGYWNQTGLSILLDQSLEKLGYDEDTKVKIIIVKK